MRTIHLKKGYKMNDFDWVLLVDDDKINNYINERLIKKLNLASQINVAFNGEEALEALEQLITTESKSNGFIFLDINMPVMDGFEFLEVFKEKYQSINGKVTIVMLTTSTNSKDLEKVKSAGIAGYINKPLTEQKILELFQGFN